MKSEERAQNDRARGEQIDIGPNRYLRPVGDIAGRVIGYVEHHPSASVPGRACSSYITLDIPENTKSLKGKWRLVSAEPLTIEPPVECVSCGNKGSITGGKWIRSK